MTAEQHGIVLTLLLYKDGGDLEGTMLEILKYIQSFSNETLDSFFEIVTMLGEDWAFIFVMAIFNGVSIKL
jgi:hypothetical protein